MSNNEILLPTRDFLRQLIGQSSIKFIDIKNILRSRGVITYSSDKENAAITLIKTGLSPEEFLEIKENLKTKEETPKLKTRAIRWDTDLDLLDCIPTNFDFSPILNDEFGTLRLSDITDFTSLNNNHVYVEFEIERDNLISNLSKNKTYHKGRMELKLDRETNSLNISLTHTSNETMDFGDALSKKIIQNFKNDGYVKPTDEIVTIKFLDFNNASRIKFLQELSQNARYTILKFKDTDDIHFSPDADIPNLPEHITWMKDKIDDLKMKGRDLHSTFFFQDKSIHPFIKLMGIKCNYIIDNNDITGTCKIEFEFSSDKNGIPIELILKLTILNIETNNDDITKNQLKKSIIESFEKYKLEMYLKYRNNPIQQE